MTTGDDTARRIALRNARTARVNAKETAAAIYRAAVAEADERYRQAIADTAPKNFRNFVLTSVS